MSAALYLYIARPSCQRPSRVRPWIDYLHISSIDSQSAGFIVMVDIYRTHARLSHCYCFHNEHTPIQHDVLCTTMFNQ